MTEEIIRNKAEPLGDYQDFISKKSKYLKYISYEQRDIVKKHTLIIQALREKHMTVKEIHKLYYDEEAKKHSITIKTVYKHLEKLEEADLVMICGHRITEGSRQAEKLYSRTANVFYPDPTERISERKVKSVKKLAGSYNEIISQVLQVPKVDETIFYENFNKINQLKYQLIETMLEEVETNETLSNILKPIELTKLGHFSEGIGMLLAYLKQPQLFKELSDVFNG